MIRGTTPVHIFKLPFDTHIVKDVWIVYAQNDTEVFRKEKKDCTFDGDSVSVTLTQEETLKFTQGMNVQVQIRVLTTDDVALASSIYVDSLGKILSSEVI